MSAPALGPARAWFAVVVATSTMAVSYVDRQAIAVLAPAITADLHLSETQFGWVSSAFSVAYLVGAPLAGAWVDRAGARRALPIAVLAWSAVAGLHALVPGMAVLIALRVALGLAESPSFPSAAQTVARVLPARAREAGFGVLFTGSSLGSAAAAALLPALHGRYGWRAALVLTAVIGLAWLPCWALATGGPVARVLDDAPARPRARGELGALLREPAVLRATVAVLASAPINGVALQWGAKALVAQHGVGQDEVGRWLWLPPILFDVGAVAFGALASARTRLHPVDPRGVTPHRLLFGAAGVLLLAIGGLGAASTPWQTTWALGLALAGGGAIYTLCTADMLSRVAPERVAAAGSWTAAAQSVALIVTFPLVGRALDWTHDYGRIGLGLAVWAVPGILLWLAWDPRPRP